MLLIDTNWKVQDILLDFVSFSDPHLGENITNAFYQNLKEIYILTKVSNNFILFILII